MICFIVIEKELEVREAEIMGRLLWKEIVGARREVHLRVSAYKNGSKYGSIGQNGPLGAFVPAPPEFAMRMLREQGGPTFEGGMNGLTHLTGPHSTGQSPIISPSTFRQDPLRLRSYQDLDAPEDEISVIDSRSLEVYTSLN